MSITFAPPVKAQPGTIEYEAERMDRLFPGWYNRINIETLDLQSCDHCIIGQAAGWDEGFDRVYQDRLSRGECSFSARGFYAFTEHKDAWIAEINRRKAS
jgi:hypothetical protein